jgi:hypothetical protein
MATAGGGQDAIWTSIAAGGQDAILASIAAKIKSSPMVNIAMIYERVEMVGVCNPEMMIYGNPDDSNPKSVVVSFNVLKYKSTKHVPGMLIKVSFSYIDVASLPCERFEAGELPEADLVMIRPLIYDKKCMRPPPNKPHAKVVIEAEGTLILVEVIPEVTAQRLQLLQLKKELDMKKAAEAQIAEDKKAKAAAALALANEKARLAERQSRALAFKREQAALEKEASRRGFPDVASMLAADAKKADEQAEVTRQQQNAEKAEHDQANAATAASEKAKNAKEARERKAAKEAADAAEHQAKFGNKKGSPPRSTSTSLCLLRAAKPLESADAVSKADMRCE